MGTYAPAANADLARDEVEDRHEEIGLFDRAFRRFIAKREAAARRLVMQHMAGFTDAQLVELGYTREQIKEVRTYPHVPLSFWR